MQPLRSSVRAVLTFTAAAVIMMLLVVAAWRDLTTRTVPDAISVVIAAIGCVERLGGSGWSGALWSALVAVSVFLALVPLHARGVLGGADLKLFAALAIGLPPLQAGRLICMSVIFGGALALVYLAARHVAHRRIGTVRPGRDALRRVLAVELWRLRRGAALPYGIAIAAGAASVLLNQSGV